MSMADDSSKPRGDLVARVSAMPADTNANGDIFGGWLVSHMDMGGSIASRRRCHSRSVTVAIDDMSFIKPVYVGDCVSVYAELLQVGSTSLKFHISVWTTGALEDDSEKKVAEGTFTFVAIDENGKPHPVDRL
jgi:acyl-CoA thioesterase YciA